MQQSSMLISFILDCRFLLHFETRATQNQSINQLINQSWIYIAHKRKVTGVEN